MNVTPSLWRDTTDTSLCESQSAGCGERGTIFITSLGWRGVTVQCLI
jgi:hypothetical protein